MEKLIKIGFFIFGLVVMIASYANTQAVNVSKLQLSAYVKQWLETNKVPAMSLTVFTPSKGYVTLNEGVKAAHAVKTINASDMFQIGSITKTFVAMAILQQVENKKITLHDKIGQWFPGFPRWKNITVLQLLNMTSGIYRYMHDDKFKETMLHDPGFQWKPLSLIKLAYGHADYFSAGAGWHYSNTNYIMLGIILKKVTGLTLADYFKTHFFSPLHLRETHFITMPYSKKQLKHMAYGYADNNSVMNVNMSAYGAAGAMISTSNDIAHWVNAVFLSKRLSNYSLDQLDKTVAFSAPPKPKNSRYGLGVYFSHSKRYGDMWWYSGVTNGYISLFIYLPRYALIVSVTTNRIVGHNYWALMPNNHFVKGLLTILIK